MQSGREKEGIILKGQNKIFRNESGGKKVKRNIFFIDQTVLQCNSAAALIFYYVVFT